MLIASGFVFIFVRFIGLYLADELYEVGGYAIAEPQPNDLDLVRTRSTKD